MKKRERERGRREGKSTRKNESSAMNKVFCILYIYIYIYISMTFEEMRKTKSVLDILSSGVQVRD
jgi:hypothetical protein